MWNSLFNAPGALARSPIEYNAAVASGVIDADEDRFGLLQGDIVSTDAGYLLGERLAGVKFVIASATCDLVTGRREYAALLRIQPITVDTPQAANLLGQLLKFQSTQRLYLPPLPQDAPGTLANAALFDGIVQIKLERLLLATRDRKFEFSGVADFWVDDPFAIGENRRWGNTIEEWFLNS
jgi:hypothetical protein